MLSLAASGRYGCKKLSEALMIRTCLAIPVVAVALLAGCSQSEKKEGHEMAGSSRKMAAAHIRPAGAASTQPSMGNVMGTVTFTQVDHGVKVVADLTGLPPGKHGFHIHEKGDLSSADLMSAGGHYNPDGGMHYHGGPVTNPMIHAGDLGNLDAAPDGKAHLE